MAVLIVMVACTSVPSKDAQSITNLDAAITDAIMQANANQYPESDFATEAHVTLKTVQSGSTTTVYAMALYLEFVYADGEFFESGGSHMPVAITFEKNLQGEYDLTEYCMPRDGTYYASSIEEKFPADIVEDALDTQKYILAEMQACYAKAVAYGEIDTDAVLEKLLETISASPAEASNLGAYIDEHAYKFRELLYYGDSTLRYAYARFLAGGQTDLQGQILLSAMRELLGDEDLGLPGTGMAQEWFDEWKSQAVSLRNAHSMKFMQENYPRTAIMLQMMDEKNS